MFWTSSALKHLSSDWILHHLCQRVYAELLMSLGAAEPGEVVCLVGPSRVGKSSIIQRAGVTLVGTSGRTSDGTLPWLCLKATNTSANADFSNKAFLQRALDISEHPFFSLPTGSALLTPKDLLRMQKTHADTALRALENTIKHLRIRYVVIDEAHHLRYAPGGHERSVAILDYWKCVADDSKFVLCLVGGYPLLESLRSASHMLGRSLVVDFPRYQASDEEDVLRFDKILLFYSKHLSLPRGVTLRDWNKLLFTGSLGCIGHLRSWLKRAVLRAAIQQDAVLQLKHLEQTRRTDAELESLLSEIVAGDDYFAATAPSSSDKGTTPTTDPPAKEKRKKSSRKAVRHPVRGLR